MRSLFFFFSILIVTSPHLSWAEEPTCSEILDGTISMNWVTKKIQDDKALDETAKKTRQAVQNAGFRDVNLNREILQKHTDSYTVVLPEGLPTDQKGSGRCWIFAALNALRSILIGQEKVSRDFEFSENYLHFFNMLEKSNRYLEKTIDLTRTETVPRKLQKKLTKELDGFGDGGWFEYFNYLVAKYGLVPKKAMQETKTSESTAILLLELRRYLASVALDLRVAANKIKTAGRDLKSPEALTELRALKETKMSGVWNIIATHLGTPPETFELRSHGKPIYENGAMTLPTEIHTYTPQTFAKEFVQFDPTDYVVVSSLPQHKYDMVYQIKDSGISAPDPSRPYGDLRFFNLKIDELHDITLRALEGGQPVWFGADVAKDFDPESGILHPDIFKRDELYSLKPEEKARKLNRRMEVLFNLAQPTHAMAMIGADKPQDKEPTIKYLVENSWGPRRDGKGAQVAANGNLHMYRPWFDKYVFVIIIHKKFLTPEQQVMWAKEAKVLNSKFLQD
jgi:bleomycin hydrolase